MLLTFGGSGIYRDGNDNTEAAASHSPILTRDAGILCDELARRSVFKPHCSRDETVSATKNSSRLRRKIGLLKRYNQPCRNLSAGIAPEISCSDFL